MSDIEIIQAIRHSGPTLESTPAGVLSIVARYSRPNVFTFSTSDKVYVTTYHYTIKEPPVTTSHTKHLLEGFQKIHNIIGEIGDDVYLVGFNARAGLIVSSFNLSTQTFTYRDMINHDCSLILSPKCLYICIRGSFRQYDLVTSEVTILPANPSGKSVIGCHYHDGGVCAFGGCYYYRGSIYIFGGSAPTKCERFDVKENKWYDIAPMPHQTMDMCITEKDGCLVVVAASRLFIYSPEKNEWTTLDRDETALLETVRYSNGKFTAVSKANHHNPMSVLECTSPERPWKPILTMGEANPYEKIIAYLPI